MYGEILSADYTSALNFKFRDSCPAFADKSEEWLVSMIRNGNLYNTDETGHYYDRLGSYSLVREKVKTDTFGGKLSKRRFTATICFNNLGEQMPAQIIHTSMVPKCSKNVYGMINRRQGFLLSFKFKEFLRYKDIVEGQKSKCRKP